LDLKIKTMKEIIGYVVWNMPNKCFHHNKRVYKNLGTAKGVITQTRNPSDYKYVPVYIDKKNL